MKLFVIATLIAVCAAGRLEHLERSYLPPDNSISNKNVGSLGSYSPSFDVGSSFGQQQGQALNSFPSASNRYLPPSNGATKFVGSVKEFGNSRKFSSPNQQYVIPSTSYGTPQSFGSFNGQGTSQSQFESLSRQYLTPITSTKQNGKFSAPNRQYPTPNSGSYKSTPQRFGSSTNGLQHQIGSSTNGLQQHIGSATNRQYLTPSTVGPQSSGRQQFGGNNAGQQQRFGAASNRQYLPPQASGSQNNRQLGATNDFEQQRYETATSRQYLAPVSSGIQRNDQQQYGGSGFGQQQRFGAAHSNSNSQYFGPSTSESQRDVHQQFGGSQKQYIAPLASSSQQSGSSRYQTMIGGKSFGEANRQYLAPHTNSFDDFPLQKFNERTGYQY